MDLRIRVIFGVMNEARYSFRFRDAKNKSVKERRFTSGSFEFEKNFNSTEGGPSGSRARQDNCLIWTREEETIPWSRNKFAIVAYEANCTVQSICSSNLFDSLTRSDSFESSRSSTRFD